MRFRVRSRITYEVRSPATLLLNVRAHSSPAQKLVREQWKISPRVGSDLIVTESEKNRFDRVRISEDRNVTIRYDAEVDVDHQLLNPDRLRKVSPAHLQPSHLPFLLPSRYCQSDQLGRFARQRFGSIADAYDQVLEIMTWIHDNVEYLPGTTTSVTSAYDTVTQCSGVCRDFAHLGIALCRALTIPARYFTGYAHLLDPPDFHACVEAFIGGHWVLFDPTRLAPPNGLVRIGLGRDAADVSVCTVFGIARTSKQDIRCEILEENFHALTETELGENAISLDTSRNEPDKDRP